VSFTDPIKCEKLFARTVCLSSNILLTVCFPQIFRFVRCTNKM